MQVTKPSAPASDTSPTLPKSTVVARETIAVTSETTVSAQEASTSTSNFAQGLVKYFQSEQPQPTIYVDDEDIPPKLRTCSSDIDVQRTAPPPDVTLHRFYEDIYMDELTEINSVCPLPYSMPIPEKSTVAISTPVVASKDEGATSSVPSPSNTENLADDVQQALSSVNSVDFSCVENPQSCGLKNDLIHSTMELVHEFTPSSIVKKDDNRSVRDLALASTSSQDIQYIDDEDCLVPALYEATSYKTDAEDSKIIKTLSERTILEIEDLIKSLAASTSHSFFYNTFNKPSPSKSNLKRKLSTPRKNEKKTLKKSELKFTNVTIFYFERMQGFCSIPSKGGSTLGMSGHHFYITTLPIDDYEHKKNLKRLPVPKHSTIIYKRSDSMDTTKSIEALSVLDRVHMLESSQVEIEIGEEEDCSHIRSSRALAGCDCKEYCYPDTCFCSLSGIECQVDRPNFPCRCSRENCKNICGRNEYNPNRVKNHFVKTMRKIKSEHKSTRSSKRKQPTLDNH